MVTLLMSLHRWYHLTSLRLCCQIRERIGEDIEVFPIPLHKHSHLLCSKFPHIEKLIGYIAVGISQIYVSHRNVCTHACVENVMYSLWLWGHDVLWNGDMYVVWIGDMGWRHACSTNWGMEWGHELWNGDMYVVWIGDMEWGHDELWNGGHVCSVIMERACTTY